MTRRMVVYLAVVALAIVLLLVLRQRKRTFIAVQVQLLQSRDGQEATEARKTLQKVGRAAVRQVCALLDHEDEEIRARAALTLANIGHARAADPLMEAAKRGDFPAADALIFMRHRRGWEARAWAYYRLADRALEELELRPPLGDRPPTAPWIDWSKPQAQFRPASHRVVHWPETLLMYGAQPRPTDPKALYDQALLGSRPRPVGAYIGRARLQELPGEYADAADDYGRALERAPESRAAKRGKARAERLAMLRGKMEELLGGVSVWPVLLHPTWRRGDVEHCVGVVRWSQLGRPRDSAARKLVAFRCERRSAENATIVPTGSVPVFATTDLPSTGSATAHVGIVRLEPGEAAAIAVVRAVGPSTVRAVFTFSYDVTLHRLEGELLMPMLQVDSATVPWVGDLDEDGDAEIVTWRWLTYPRASTTGMPWPTVRSLVNGRYEIRTEQFPSLFEDVAAVLVEREREYPLDSSLSDGLGQAYEVLAKKDLAIAAYQRAEKKHLEMADRMAKKGESEQARLHRRAALAVKDRRLRLEPSGGS